MERGRETQVGGMSWRKQGADKEEDRANEPDGRQVWRENQAGEGQRKTGRETQGEETVTSELPSKSRPIILNLFSSCNLNLIVYFNYVILS